MSMTSASASRRLLRDPHVLLGLGIALPIALTSFAVRIPPAPLVALASGVFLGVQAVAALAVPRTRRRGVGAVRLGVALLYVATVVGLGADGSTRPFLLFYVPIVVLAAALGGAEAVFVGACAVGASVALVPIGTMPDAFVRERALALASIAALLAIGTRRTVGSLERATTRLRETLQAERIRSRRLAGVEAVGRQLAESGATDESMRRVVELLALRFGYGYVSIYLGGPDLMRLGAQSGYADPIESFRPSGGVLGRVMRTREPTLVPDVSADPDYIQAGDIAQSLICVPLIARGELIGVVNVESAPPAVLGNRDLAAVRLVADRLASALALSREHERLARRAARFEALTAFGQGLTTTLEPTDLHRLIGSSIGTVIPADEVALTVRDSATGEYRIVAGLGGDSSAAGERGLADRAVRALGLVHDAASPSSIAIPLIREGRAIGAITLTRHDGAGFDDLDREVLPLVATQSALAITNAELHHTATEASVRDALTGIHNRRFLDESIARLAAGRLRRDLAERRPLSVILFDLDHFGRLNKRYGHAVGDEVLRRFATLLRERFRASDLIARYGGEEFMVLLEGSTRDEAVRCADEVRARFAAVRVAGPNDELVGATVSAGCAGLDDEADLDAVLAAADVGLAMAKAAGRDQVVAA